MGIFQSFSRVILASAFALTAVSATSAFAAELVDKIVVIVNEEIITLSDIADFEQRLKTGGLIDDQLVPNDSTRQTLLKDREALVKKLIDARLIDAEVKKQNLTVPFEQVEQEIRSIAKRNGMQRDDLKNALAEKGVNFASYQDFIKTGLERQSLVTKSVTSKIKISEDDVLAAMISMGLASNTQAFEYSLARILFLNAKSGGADGARAQATQAMEKLKEGSSFDRVAADFSQEENFEVGGALPQLSSTEMPPDLEKAVSKLSPGEWTQPIPTNGGLQIVRLIKRRLIANPETEKIKNDVRAKLGEKRFREYYDIWLESLRSEASIRINK